MRYSWWELQGMSQTRPNYTYARLKRLRPAAQREL